MAGGGQQNWGAMTPYNQASTAQGNALSATQAAMQGNANANANAQTYNPNTYNANTYNAQTYNPNSYNAQNMQGASYTAANQAGPAAISSGINGYMNPYTSQVIDQTSADLQRQNQALQTQNAGAATAAGAFGGGRHGLVEAQTNADTQRQLATTSADLRNTGWNQAAQLSGQDITNRMSVNSANQQAQNAARSSNAGWTQAASAANQAAQNSANQWNAGAKNEAGQYNAGAVNTARNANQGALNSAGQFNAGAQNAAGQYNAGARTSFGQNQFNNALSGAAQMSNLGQTSFNTGNTLNNQLATQGQQGQNIAQGLLGQAAGMFDQYTGQPMQNVNNRLAALGANPMTQTGTQTGTSQYKPGLMDFLGLGAGTAGAALGGK